VSLKLIKSKRNILIGAALLVSLVSLVIILNGRVSQQPTSPKYETVLPSGKTVEELGGWKLSSPPNSEPVFSYNDSIEDIAISVSQQPLPKSFEGDTGNRVAELAKQNNATTEISVNNTKVYIGASAKGPQSVIFVKDNLLIFIKSQEKISNDSWSKYIQNLTN
jgi:hypothetical protein